MQSCRSIAIVKSVAIHPQVTEYHYTEEGERVEEGGGEEEWEDRLTVDFSEEADASLEEEEKPTGSIIPLPAPIYPSVDRKHLFKSFFSENRKSFTKDQIINLYCPNEIIRQ